MGGDRTLGQRSGDVRRAVEDKLGQASSPFPAPLALNVVPWAGSLRGLFCGGTLADEAMLVLPAASVFMSMRPLTT